MGRNALCSCLHNRKLNRIPSIFLTPVWAGRSAWNDRGVGIAEVAGSNPAPSTIESSQTGHFSTNFPTCDSCLVTLPASRFRKSKDLAVGADWLEKLARSQFTPLDTFSLNSFSSRSSKRPQKIDGVEESRTPLLI